MTTLTFEERERRAYITNDPSAPVLGAIIDAEFDAVEEAQMTRSELKTAEDRIDELEIACSDLEEKIAELEAREDLT